MANTPVRQHVPATRERHRKAGMKLVQIWVADPASPQFRAEVAREVQAFRDKVSQEAWDDLP